VAELGTYEVRVTVLPLPKFANRDDLYQPGNYRKRIFGAIVTKGKTHAMQNNTCGSSVHCGSGGLFPILADLQASLEDPS
jgi:hypothetical protein